MTATIIGGIPYERRMGNIRQGSGLYGIVWMDSLFLLFARARAWATLALGDHIAQDTFTPRFHILPFVWYNEIQ
jgi:hypothetical protein